MLFSFCLFGAFFYQAIFLSLVCTLFYVITIPWTCDLNPETTVNPTCIFGATSHTDRFSVDSFHNDVSLLKSTRHFFWLGHQNAWKKYLNGTKSIKNTLKFIFHLWKTVTRWRCSRKIWRNILKTAISPLLNHFHRWYGYQNKRDSSSIVHALAFCAQIGLHFNKVRKTSKKHAIFGSF
mgnify:CR=1 FL=1